MSQPIKGEKKETYINRCMLEEDSVKDSLTEKERLQICNRVWETHSREALNNYVKSLKEK